MSRAVVPGRQEGVTVQAGSGLGFVFRPKGCLLSAIYPLQVAPAMGLGLSFPLFEG